jgi:hypothetical protein
LQTITGDVSLHFIAGPAEQESGADWRAGELHLLKSSDFRAHCFHNNPLCRINSVRIFTMSIHTVIIAALLSLAILGVFGQANPTAPEPKFTKLTRDDSARLEQERAVVAAIAKQRYGTMAITGTKSDLPVLQRLIDEKVFAKSQTYDLQCLGVTFGDVLTSELPLRWVMITDEYGTDPTLRFKKTTLQINALTMISKRVERDAHVDVSELLRITRQQLAQIR